MSDPTVSNKNVVATRAKVKKGQANLLEGAGILSEQPKVTGQRIAERELEGREADSPVETNSIVLVTEDNLFDADSSSGDEDLTDEHESLGEETEFEMATQASQLSITKFDGRRSNSTEARTWLKKVVLGMPKRTKPDAELDESDLERQQDLILLRLDGPAFNWASDLFESERKCGWRTFKGKFEAKYVNIVSPNEAFRRLSALKRKPDRTVHEFLEYAQGIFDILGNGISDSMKNNAIFEAHDEYYKERLYGSLSKSTERFKAKLIEVDQMKEIVHRKPRRAQDYVSDKKVQSSTEPAATKATVDKHLKGKKEKLHVSLINCFECGDKGHYAANCERGGKDEKKSEDKKHKGESKKISAVTVEDTELPESPVYTCQTITSVALTTKETEHEVRPFVKFLVDGLQETFLVDTGAQKSTPSGETDNNYPPPSANVRQSFNQKEVLQNYAYNGEANVENYLARIVRRLELYMVDMVYWPRMVHSTLSTVAEGQLKLTVDNHDIPLTRCLWDQFRDLIKKDIQN
ncbi:hypothetical protein HDE_02609 [Halotydeus destructor]|nr:hypothetical protein HDE_02609 [Halotydeus destructor]